MAPSEQHDSTGERWLSYYARVGYGAKGVIYGSSGLLALMESFDLKQGETVGSTGALRTIARQPFGQLMIATLAVSLMGYVSWRFIQAALDPEHSGCEAKDVLRRFGYFCSGLIYTGLAFSAVKILMHADDKGGKTAEE